MQEHRYIIKRKKGTLILLKKGAYRSKRGLFLRRFVQEVKKRAVFLIVFLYL